MTISKELSNAYFTSKYVAHCGQEVIILPASGESEELIKLLQKHNAESCAFITAYNPEGIDTDIAINKTNQMALLAEVSINWEYYNGYGVDYKELREPEPSLLILGISLDEARKLSRRYHQNAFLYASQTGRTELITTNPDDQSDLVPPLNNSSEQQKPQRNYLLEASVELNKIFSDSGFPVTKIPRSRTGRLEATFVPAKRVQSKPPEE